VKVTSAHSTITAQAKLMDGVNPNTVWTWNAIGKRSGAWNLDPDAGESKRGFLLNHLIRDFLPPREGGYRYANSDPVAGQAAWYDLRVRCSASRKWVSGSRASTRKSCARSVLRWLSCCRSR
jgi:sulfite dehydrogenase (quinone) subunit SoeA